MALSSDELVKRELIDTRRTCRAEGDYEGSGISAAVGRVWRELRVSLPRS